MSTLAEYKIIDNNLEVNYEIITPVDISTTLHDEHGNIIAGLNNVEECLSRNQKTIDELNDNINKLTSHNDGIDNIIAVASGIISGLIDSFFVGEFSLDEGTKWGKEKVDSFVQNVAKRQGYNGDSLSGAVKFLEDKFPIPADSATAIFGGGTQHHLRDFSHHPTPLGLLFSMLTQFTGKVYGTNTLGAFIIEDVPSTDLIGKDFTSKLAIGFTHWIFHMVSDIAGSSSSIAYGKYGTGLPGPFLSLLKEISSLPFFSHQENNNKFCVFISKLFNGTLLSKRGEDGKIIPDSVIKFDLRAEIGVLYELGKQAIPVIINECVVRISYFVRRLVIEFKSKEIKTFNDFIYNIEWKNTLPFNNRTIVRMVTIDSGTFVAIDVADAAIRSGLKSGGEPAAFLTNMILHVNFVGIGRFAVAIGTDIHMGYKEGKLRNERMYRQTEQIMLNCAKVYYKQADMWLSARDAAEAIDKMKAVAEKSIAFYRESLAEIGIDLYNMGQCKSGIEQNNPQLLDDLSRILKYGE